MQQSIQLPGYFQKQSITHMNPSNIYQGMANNVPQKYKMGYVQMPPPPPLPNTPSVASAHSFYQHMTTPNPPQIGCAQFPMRTNNYYRSAMLRCYQHYQTRNVPLTPIMRLAV